MSPERLENILEAESAFNDIYKGPVERLLLTMKLLALFGKRKLKKEDPRFLQVIRKEMLRRLFETRSAGVTKWRNSARVKHQE
ncbi:MAG: hypothetical protein JST28_12180 [Acidobacteria bacterium]|nr:hypothetical protein [Acidobacteriota bacterium]